MKSKFKLTIKHPLFNYEFQPLRIIKYSDGTVQAQIVDERDIITLKRFNEGNIIIDATILDSDGIILLCQIKDIIDYYIKPQNIHLLLTYTPYARYDRRMTTVDSFSLKVFGNIINSLKFDRVYIADVHSTVTLGCINNSIEHISQLEAIQRTISENDMKKYNYIVSPDVGALKKATSIADHFNIQLLTALKKRDVNTGYTVFDRLMVDESDNVKDSTVLIVDDLCDGGYTFVNLAQNLKEKYEIKHVDLFVTHGIFSKGQTLDYIDNSYCYNNLREIIYS